MSRYIPLLLPLVLALAACSSDTPAPTRPDAQPGQTKPTPADARKKIVFFGNSLTAAYNLAPEQGFPALIQHKIDSLGLPYECVNAGLSGETTADGKNRVDWVLQQPIDVFVLELGGNDALRGLPVEASRNNLKAILDKVRARYPDCRIVIAGMLAPPNLGDDYTRAFQKMYPDLAREYKALLVPFLLENVAAISRLNLEDGIHPNEMGHKIVAQNVWKILKPIL